MEHNKCSDMANANCSLTYSSRQTCFALRRAYQRYLFMNSKHHKSDAVQVAIQLLVVTSRETYIRTQAVCA